MRATRNFEGMHQGQLCVLDLTSITQSSVNVYVAPTLDSVNDETIANEVFVNWKRIIVRKTPGFIYGFKGNSLRRIQFPLINYVALTVHKLMGDTFLRLATAISRKEGKYCLWLISQIYVIISRVKYLRDLYIVGDKSEICNAIKEILTRRSLQEERLFEIFESLRVVSKHCGVSKIATPKYLQRFFDVPETENGFLFVLVSLKDKEIKTFFIGQTNSSLADELKKINSTETISNRLYNAQPWAMGFSFGVFRMNNKESTHTKAWK